MSGDSFGKLFKVSSWGESHGPAVGMLIEGCPAGLKLDIDAINFDLQRRKPGQSKIVTQRKEEDTFEILSGIVDGVTTGTPINIQIKNKDQRSKDYQSINQVYRPSHADFTYQMKYGIRDVAGGGRSSARITAGHVAAGAIAKQVLKQAHGVEILAYVNQVYNIKADIDPLNVTIDQVEANPVRCPDQTKAGEMEALIKSVRKDGDSVGGIITCVIKSAPLGLGEPVFDKISADLGKAMLSINAVKGFDIGSGFDCVAYKGSEHNDSFYNDNGTVKTRSNFAGGVLGGITTGMPIISRIAFKPTATIIKTQNTVDSDGNEIEFKPQGRHDPCVLPRAVPIVEAMAALTLCDHLLRHKATQVLK